MKNIDIESILRDNRDNPTFILEVEQKMRAVEGIRNEVDTSEYSWAHTKITYFYLLLDVLFLTNDK